uniref:Uncharacterized protein n=1 Tax=Aegilops tauschii subsp. strangulata TaxID=200361 RepID=A0A453J4E6_AEGTS
FLESHRSIVQHGISPSRPHTATACTSQGVQATGRFLLPLRHILPAARRNQHLAAAAYPPRRGYSSESASRLGHTGHTHTRVNLENLAGATRPGPTRPRPDGRSRPRPRRSCRPSRIPFPHPPRAAGRLPSCATPPLLWPGTPTAPPHARPAHPHRGGHGRRHLGRRRSAGGAPAPAPLPLARAQAARRHHVRGRGRAPGAAGPRRRLLPARRPPRRLQGRLQVLQGGARARPGRAPPLAALLQARQGRLRRRLPPPRLAPTLLLLPAAASSPSSSSPTALGALALLKSGYKLSKNSAKVVEGFLGLQVHKGFRNGVDALGVVVKVAVIASEVAVWVGGRFWGADDDGRGRCVRFLGLTRTTTLVLAGSAKSEAQVVLFDPGTAVEMEDEGCWLEEDPDPSLLLCLAVPLPA